MRRLLCVLSVLVLLVACGGEFSPTAPTTIPPQPYTATDIRSAPERKPSSASPITVNYAVWLFSSTWSRTRAAD